MALSRGHFAVKVLPRVVWTWGEFLANTPRRSIALDGIVRGGPRFDEATLHQNFDHHDGVVREATMSTAMQVFYAIKGGIARTFTKQSLVVVNDTDQDTALAVWLLRNHAKFEGSQSIPHVNRLLALTDRLDITGGAFPMNLDDDLIQNHNYVFGAYTALRKSGKLAEANEAELQDNLEATLARLDQFLMGASDKAELDTRHEILHSTPEYKIIDEIGGNEARYWLFSQGLDAFVSLVARRSDGRFVYTIGRRSQYIPFPIIHLYKDLSDAEGLSLNEGWNGSTIIGGSPRAQGSKLTWQEIQQIVDRRIAILKEETLKP